jgi:hypothetical protein
VPVRESHLERQFSQMVRARGGLAIKMAPTIAGIPDRLVLWPNGKSNLVELKTSTGNLRAIQVHRHKELLDLGHSVVVLRGEQDIVDWIDDVHLGFLASKGHNANCSPFCEGDHPPVPEGE